MQGWYWHWFTFTVRRREKETRAVLALQCLVALVCTLPYVFTHAVVSFSPIHPCLYRQQITMLKTKHAFALMRLKVAQSLDGWGKKREVG